MNRVDEAAERYLEMWNSQYAIVNEIGIVAWAVSQAMRDIERWIEGSDPNGAREQPGMVDCSRDELIGLYRWLSPTASFFEYSPASYRDSDGPP